MFHILSETLRVSIILQAYQLQTMDRGWGIDAIQTKYKHLEKCNGGQMFAEVGGKSLGI